MIVPTKFDKLKLNENFQQQKNTMLMQIKEKSIPIVQWISFQQFYFGDENAVKLPIMKIHTTLSSLLDWIIIKAVVTTTGRHMIDWHIGYFPIEYFGNTI